MKIRALKGFGGMICMHKGQVLNYGNEAVVQDLLACGYVELVVEEVAAPEEPTEPENITKEAKPKKTVKKKENNEAGELDETE